MQSARIDILQVISRTSACLLFYIVIDIEWGNREDDEDNNQEEVIDLPNSPSKDHCIESNYHMQINCQLQGMMCGREQGRSSHRQRGSCLQRVSGIQTNEHDYSRVLRPVQWYSALNRRALLE